MTVIFILIAILALLCFLNIAILILTYDKVKDIENNMLGKEFKNDMDSIKFEVSRMSKHNSEIRDSIHGLTVILGQHTDILKANTEDFEKLVVAFNGGSLPEQNKKVEQESVKKKQKNKKKKEINSREDLEQL